MFEDELRKAKGEEVPYLQVAKEITSSYPSVGNICITSGANVQHGSTLPEHCVLVVADISKEFSDQERIRLTQWLKIRLNSENLILIVRRQENKPESTEEPEIRNEADKK